MLRTKLMWPVYTPNQTHKPLYTVGEHTNLKRLPSGSISNLFVTTELTNLHRYSVPHKEAFTWFATALKPYFFAHIQPSQLRSNHSGGCGLSCKAILLATIWPLNTSRQAIGRYHNFMEGSVAVLKPWPINTVTMQYLLIVLISVRKL